MLLLQSESSARSRDEFITLTCTAAEMTALGKQQLLRLSQFCSVLFYSSLFFTPLPACFADWFHLNSE